MDKTFDWIPFYEELANKLLEYKDKRNDLFERMKKIVPQHTKLEFLHLDRADWWGPRNFEMDPLTIFSTFNRGLTAKNRIEIATIYASEFDIKSAIPSDFTGVPVVNTQNSFFNGSDEIWALFEAAIQCSDNNDFTEVFERAFEDAIAVFNNGLATITIGLFWIRPYTYMNLDSQNKELLDNPVNGLSAVVEVLPNSIKKHIPTGREYVLMLNEIQRLLSSNAFEYRSLPELSDYSWAHKPEASGKGTKHSKASFLKWLAPLVKALNDLGGSGTPKEAIAKIASNENVDDVILNETRGKTNMKKFDNEVNWARNYLVYAGVIDKSKRGIWTLTEQGKDVIITDELATKIFKKEWTVETELPETFHKKYWIYAPGAQAFAWKEFYKSGIMGIEWEELGDLSEYSSKEDVKESMKKIYHTDKTYMNDSLAVWQFANEMQIGDVVYAKKGKHGILGRGIIESEYIYDEARTHFTNIRKVKWTHKGEYLAPYQSVVKTLTDLTQYTEYVEKLEALFFGDEIPPDEEVITYPPYQKENFLSQVYMEESNYETIKQLLLRKKNIILQGAPGVGKTFAAKRLAYSLMGEIDSSRVQMLQFHQSYSYEDFIMGYRPDGSGFKLAHGAFYRFCKKAQVDNERDYFFIIDEINRGNLSKIFGELFMLIEHDKRDEKNSIRLLYENEQFYIPSNIHIIGMMNTADRSLAMLDYALRRRFAFFEMEPAFDSSGFKTYQSHVSNHKFNALIEVVKVLNNTIKEDDTLGSGFRIGHSYFIKGESDVIDDIWLDTVVNYEIIPLLQEYWFDENSKVDNWSSKLRSAIL